MFCQACAHVTPAGRVLLARFGSSLLSSELPVFATCASAVLGVHCIDDASMQGGFKNIVVYNPRTMHGYLQPGHWDYYAMILDPMDTSWMVSTLVCAI